MPLLSLIFFLYYIHCSDISYLSLARLKQTVPLHQNQEGSLREARGYCKQFIKQNGTILLASLVLSKIAYLVLVVVELIAVARLEDFEAVRA